MRSGKRSKISQLKIAAAVLLFVVLFIYANASAEKDYQADVRILADSSILPPLVKDISEAKENIYIAIYMFKSYSNTKNGAGLLKRALIDAAKRGVKVSLTMDRAEESEFVYRENKKLGKELQKYNIKITFDNPANRMHTKCVVIDERITYLGSHNYTNSALKYNKELSVRIVSKDAAADALSHIFSIE